MVVTKARTDSPSHWRTYHTGLTDYTYALSLNSQDAEFTGSGLHAVPTSSVFALTNSSQRNQNTINYIAYCFAEIEGYSKFGSYTGNGNQGNGAFIYTAFRPAFVMVKNTDEALTSWVMVDSARSSYNPAYNNLFADQSIAENASNYMQGLHSNGFKWNGASSWVNKAGQKYVYMAFAENPFVTSSGVPVTAR
jgi:hypothetical protein